MTTQSESGDLAEPTGWSSPAIPAILDLPRPSSTTMCWMLFGCACAPDHVSFLRTKIHADLMRAGTRCAMGARSSVAQTNGSDDDTTSRLSLSIESRNEVWFARTVTAAL